MPVRQCEWCGHDHAVTQLCAQRPKWSRRGFLSLLGAAIASAALPLPSWPTVLPIPFDASVGNVLVTPEWFTRETARLFVKNLQFLTNVNRDYDARFLVGDKIAAHLPQRFA